MKQKHLVKTRKIWLPWQPKRAVLPIEKNGHGAYLFKNCSLLPIATNHILPFSHTGHKKKQKHLVTVATKIAMLPINARPWGLLIKNSFFVAHSNQQNPAIFTTLATNVNRRVFLLWQPTTDTGYKYKREKCGYRGN